MKLLLLLFLVTCSQILYSQVPCDHYTINFEDSVCLDQLIIDTTNYPGNIWQIGAPQKPSFGNAFSWPYAIVTDTLNPYPVNNMSVFTIWNPASMGDIYGLKLITGYYYVQSDSLADQGRIELSPDQGTTWIDLVHDNIYSSSITWITPKPVLTGNSGGWVHFEVILADLGSIFNIQLGDTILYRFSFFSDGNPENDGGLMYDNLSFFDFVEGVTETRFKPVKSTIYPNPSSQIFTIEYEKTDAEIFQLAVYDEHSKMVLSIETITENKIHIQPQALKPGVYYYKLTNLKDKKRSWGKFVVQ